MWKLPAPDQLRSGSFLVLRLLSVVSVGGVVLVCTGAALHMLPRWVEYEGYFQLTHVIPLPEYHSLATESGNGCGTYMWFRVVTGVLLSRSPNLCVVPCGPGRRACTWYVVGVVWVGMGPGESWVLAPGVSWVSART